MAPQPTDMPSSFEAQNKRPKWQSANSGPLKDPPRTRPDEGERMMSKSMKVQGPKQLSTKLSSISQPQKGHRDEADASVVQSVILDPYDETPIADSRPKDSNYSTSTPSSSTIIKKGQHVTPSFGQKSQQTSSLSRKTRWQLRPSPVKVNPVDTKEFSTKEFSKSLTTKEMTTTSNLPRNQHNCYHQEGVQEQNNLAQKNEETSNQMQYYRKIPVKTLMAPSKPPAHVWFLLLLQHCNIDSII